MRTLHTRAAGILLPISSLPSRYGIGTFGKEACRFVDFLGAAGQRCWQVLPLGQTGFGDSPYQSYSAFAGNPYFIDLERLLKDGLLQPEELREENFGVDPSSVDYEKLFLNRLDVLRLAFGRSRHETRGSFRAFAGDNADWLEDYALFMALKTRFRGASWQEWPREIKQREPQAMEQCRSALDAEIRFWKFIQFVFFTQWKTLKAYANQRSIRIIGDIPIYVSGDSADAWANSELFELDEAKNPLRLAGVPPDFFSQTGQLWGNPLYDWKYAEKTGFDWWKRRMRMSALLFDVTRIDHFIGFSRYYAVPANNADARGGTYEEGPAMSLIRAIREAVPDGEFIAENLGVMTPEADALLEKTGFPGMKVLLFAFDGDPANPDLPQYYTRNNVVYTGTHDNDTAAGFFGKNPEAFQTAVRYLGAKYTGNIVWDLIRLAYESAADTAIIPMQDFLELSSDARMNTPQTIGCNWKWRLRGQELTAELAEKIRKLACETGRSPKDDAGRQAV